MTTLPIPDVLTASVLSTIDVIAVAGDADAGAVAGDGDRIGHAADREVAVVAGIVFVVPVPLTCNVPAFGTVADGLPAGEIGAEPGRRQAGQHQPADAR